MANKTEGVKELVQDVLSTFSEPYGEDIILEVCQAIEENQEWLRRYEELNDELNDGVVNQWAGHYVKSETGQESLRVVSAKGKSGLIKSYTKLGRG
ncbi:MAG: hypothetical protein HOD49_06075 [Anaerolineae bacterium]|jgi:hypothetical protein|nr:hypothetical protein [Anaerolineae bacterium]